MDVSGFIPNFALLIPGSLCFFKLSGLFFLQIYSDYSPSASKVIRDKHLYIIKDDKTYTIDGKKGEVKDHLQIPVLDLQKPQKHHS